MKMSVLALVSLSFKHAAQYYGISLLDFNFTKFSAEILFPLNFSHLIYIQIHCQRIIYYLINQHGVDDYFFWQFILYFTQENSKEIKLVSRCIFVVYNNFPNENQPLKSTFMASLRQLFCNEMECSEGKCILYILYFMKPAKLNDFLVKHRKSSHILSIFDFSANTLAVQHT